MLSNTLDTINDRLERYVNVDDDVDRSHLLQCHGLGLGPREAVKEPRQVLDFLELRGHHVHHEVIGNQVAAVHEALGLLAQLGAIVDVLPEQVTRADMLKPKITDDPIRYSSFSASRSS